MGVHDIDNSRRANATLVRVILFVAVAYFFAWTQGLPQRATEQVIAAKQHDADHADEEHSADIPAPADSDPASPPDDSAAGHDHDTPKLTPPPLWMITPFCLLLAAIALFPLLPGVEHWWEFNGSRFLVAVTLSAVTLLYYGLLHDHAIEGHFPAHYVEQPAGEVFEYGLVATIFANAILYEYIPFIVLLFSLYSISGGIRISGDLPAHPITNVAYITIGGALASFIGTTGAAMLLIRPLLETNAERKHVRHTVVFFIFVVCNCGGLLLPIGDPPLFLGYLRGVEFFWTLKLWPYWLAINAAIIAVYYVWDKTISYPDETFRDVVRDEVRVTPLRIRGLAVNGVLLLGVVASVAFLAPDKAVPGTHWHAPYYLREVVQLALVGLSLWLGSERARADNRFNYHAIVEVAALFCGIFICMQPALQILAVKGAELGIDTQMAFFWITGGLSSVLDNAPTYVVFFETAKTVPVADAPTVAGVPEPFLVAISLGAVFLGAMTYIGNGPNFMVRAIAESSGVKMPSFLGYFVYSAAILGPIFAVMSWIVFA